MAQLAQLSLSRKVLGSMGLSGGVVFPGAPWVCEKVSTFNLEILWEEKKTNHNLGASNISYNIKSYNN